MGTAAAGGSVPCPRLLGARPPGSYGLLTAPTLELGLSPGNCCKLRGL